MKIAVRTDAGVAMGVGHVMRGLALVTKLRASVESLEVLFICRVHTGHLEKLIRARGFSIKLLPVELGEMNVK